MNLYNFMDGIDGIAAVQCILAAGCIGLLVLVYGGDQRYVLFCLLLVLAQTGFLLVNWPPARLFMGDAGSVPTGFLLGGLAILGWVEDIVPPGSWLILGAPFIVDATWTLVQRWRRGEPVTEGHRQHAYQRLARHWGSHLLVDLLLLALNAVWLFPLAWAAFVWPDQQWVLVILAIMPLLFGMARLRELT
jgi:Fuc2NAc and GlcNAc transferase